ncbi:unnamed protein product [Vitrella brassicaformis CCMP3155]|uniref:Uncharacterized protein n=1 Tax=Vitrella brassicaformis (strain CCMP3155) TaxID=1169540 RepID=A0A0G4FMS1_VITBC|nr:unnamed protein product [Vitrella brassicaformis CCMP3155]|eukprot:CEM15537.1 unnamed protein product [Vitrella brassicaformis CCMP3155]
MWAGGTASQMAVADLFEKLAEATAQFEMENFMNGSGEYINVIRTHTHEVQVYCCKEVFDKLALAHTRFEVENFLNGSGEYIHIISTHTHEFQVYYCKVLLDELSPPGGHKRQTAESQISHDSS